MLLAKWLSNKLNYSSVSHFSSSNDIHEALKAVLVAEKTLKPEKIWLKNHTRAPLFPINWTISLKKDDLLVGA